MQDQDLRDAFAGFALIGLIVGSADYKFSGSVNIGIVDYKTLLAEQAYKFADAMIEVRNK
jgi:hypothetical protein